MKGILGTIALSAEPCNAGFAEAKLPKLHNKYHKTASAEAVYIGRPSVWGNPFSVQEYGREKAIELYRKWIFAPEQKELRERARKELRDKDLVCFCKPKACHGDWLLEVANYESEPEFKEIVGMGYGQWDGPGTEVYCRPIYGTPVSPEENQPQETHDQKENRKRGRA